MRRVLGLASLCGIILLNQGCHHVGGKCDCGKDAIPGSCNYYSNATVSAYATPAPGAAAVVETGTPKQMPPKVEK